MLTDSTCQKCSCTSEQWWNYCAMCGHHIAAGQTLQIPGDWPADYQAQFWALYPRKTDKKAAIKSLDKVAFEGKTRWVDLINGIERYKLSNDVKKGYSKHPATFLNKGSWMDEEQTGPVPINGPVSFFDGLEI